MMIKLKEVVINLATSKLNKPLTPDQITLIENGLLNTFSTLKTPTHPTYASMIEEAIKKLVEEGSLITEKLISEYIIENYEGLPWAHDTYLKHHLNKACDRGELICDVDATYMTPDQNKRESLKKKLYEQNDVDGSNCALDQKVRRSLRKKLSEQNNDIVGNDCGLDQNERSLRKKTRAKNYDINGMECIPEQNERRSLRTKLREGSYDLDGSDCSGDKNDQKSSRRKLLKRKSRDNKEEDVIEGNLVREEVNELSDSQVGLQEGVSQEYGRGKRKRKRKHIYDDQEEGEVVQTRVVVGEGNLDRGNEIVGNEMLLLEVGEVECKSSETNNEDNGVVEIIANGKSVTQSDVECSKEVKNQVIQLDHHLSEGRNELEPSALPGNAESVSECNIARDHHQNSTGSLMLAPVALVSNIETDATGSTRKPNPRASELMIVPYVDNSVYSDGGEQIVPLSKCIDPIIVCGLLNDKKLKVYNQRKRRSKLPKEKTKVQEEEPNLASFDLSVQRSLETNLQQKLQSSKLQGTTLLEETTAKQLDRRKSSHGSSLEIISIEDEEPHKQLIEKSGNLKRHGMQGAKSKAASALVSSKAGAPPEDLPSSEVETTPTVEKESASRKVTDKQLHRHLWSHNKTCAYVKDYTCGKSSASLLKGSGMCGEAERSQLQVSYTSEVAIAMLGQATEFALDGGSQRLNERPKFRCSQKKIEQKESKEHHQQEVGSSDPSGHGTSDNQHSEQEKPHTEDNEDQSLPEVRHQDLETPEIPVLDQDPQQQKPRPGKPPKTGKLPVNNRKISKPTMKTVAHGQVRTRMQGATKKDAAVLLDPNLKEQKQHLQNQNNPLKKSGRGRHKKSKETPPEPFIVPMDLWAKHEEEQQGSGTATGRRLDQQNRRLEENEENISNLQLKEELSKPATRMHIKGNVIKDHLAGPLKLQHQQEVGLSEPVNNQQSQIKKTRRGRPKMQKEVDKDGDAIVSVTYHELDGMHGSLNREDRNNRRSVSPEELETKSGAAPSNLQCPEHGDLKSSSHAVHEASVTQRQIDLKESVPASDSISCPDFEQSAAVTFAASTCLADQPSQRHKDHNQPTRRITRSSEAAKFLECKAGKQHDQVLSDQRSIAKPALAYSGYHCPAKEWDHEQQEKRYVGDHACEKIKVQVKPHKELSAKCSSIQIREALSTQGQIESIPVTSYCPDFEPPAMSTFEVSMSVADQSIHKDQNKPTRRVTRRSEAAKFLESENGKQHIQEMSDQRRLEKPMPALVPSDHVSVKDLEQEENSHDHEQAHKQMEVREKLSEEMTAKSASVQILEASSAESQIDLKESIPATSERSCGDFDHTMVSYDPAMCLVDQSRHKDGNQLTRRSTRSSEAAKNLESRNGKQYEQELSDQRRLVKPIPAFVPSGRQCPDEESENQEQKRSYLKDQPREEKEFLVKPRKDMSAKTTSTHVPLSSKHQLRSRVKRQSQDST